MGLTIHYELRARVQNPRAARDLVERLRESAAALPFALVGHVLDADDSAIAAVGPDDPRRWLFSQAARWVWRKGEGFRVAPRRLFAFSTSPGAGCEEANFGLALYSATLDVAGRPRRTGLTGWSWASFCKTQYAARPEVGGVANFLQCHLAVIDLLDAAKTIGLAVDVVDEGGFWEQRDPDALAGQVGGQARPSPFADARDDEVAARSGEALRISEPAG
jgi:hypothetical protein